MLILAGYGFVGKAYYELLSQKYSIQVVDPAYNNATISDYPEALGVLCCVGTPTLPDGTYDLTAIHDVISKTAKEIPILIKSTITVACWYELKKCYPDHRLTFSPEFLRAETAIKDVLNTSYIILAGDAINYWASVFGLVLPGVSFFIATPEEAIVTKQFINAFLATKVSFFNQIYDYCNNLGIDYAAVEELITLDNRIGTSHTTINHNPRGWGGYCFPKDTSALLNDAENKDISLSVLDAACSYNQKIRSN